MARSTNKSQFPTVTTAGGLLPADFLLTLKTGIERQSGSDLPGLQTSDYHLGGETFGEATNRAWNALQGRWQHFKAYLDEREDTDTTHGETWDRFLRPLFRELGYGQLERNLAVEIDTDTYKITHHWRKVAIHLLGAGISIDKRTPGAEGAAKKSPHAMVQEFLNRSDDHLWAFVANGLNLRILRDNVSLTRQAYVEFDLSAMFEGGEYADFQLLWLLCHQSRVEGEPPETCWLERWATEAKQRGVRMLDGLRDGVETSISALGEGFLKHPDNRALRERLTSGELSTQDYYRQVLRIVYRLIFLFVAEDRNLLLVTDAPEEAKRRYRRHYATDRLRELAQRRRGSVHPDLWEQLKLIMRALGSPEGQPALALPALGSFLWDAERSTPDLADVTLSNTYLLDAIRALATIRAEKEKVRRVVDYRNLGAEELGSVYESLLELHPQINLDARTFALDSSAGNDRKTSGSYYTPDSLVQCLLDTALEPVIKDRLAEARKANHANSAEAKATAQQQALLDLKVCDPAVGSGHFLIAAGHRIARHLARIRSGEEEPSPADYQDALRDVVGRCLYGVDLNPMAVELCKVSLWIEAMEPGKPLSFLEHHIRCGNSLLGTTPKLIEEGIPDPAYKPLMGDTKESAGYMKKLNKDFLRGQDSLFDRGSVQPWEQLGNLPAVAAKIEAMADDDLDAVAAKEEAFHSLIKGGAYENTRLLADAWCAAFVWPKHSTDYGDTLTSEHLRKIERNPHSLEPSLRLRIRELAKEYQFFHWHLEFPGVFRMPSPMEAPDSPDSGLCGGFNVVLGNPPWEKLQTEELQFFAQRHPDIANLKGAERKRAIRKLQKSDPPLSIAWERQRRFDAGVVAFVRHSSLFSLTGVGKFNSFAVFAELNRLLTSSDGHVGCIVQSDIAYADTCKAFFADIVKKRHLCSFYDFVNTEGLFPAIHRTHPHFCLLTMSRANALPTADFAFWNTNVGHLSEVDRHFPLGLADIEILNPNTQTCPIFRSQRDASLSKAMYRRIPVLVQNRPTQNYWQVSLHRMFNLTDDSSLFVNPATLEAGTRNVRDAIEVVSTRYLPLYEAKHVHQFDHRWGNKPGARGVNDYVCPRYYIEEQHVSDYLDAHNWDRDWLLGWRDITNTTNERTAIATVIPRTGVGNTIYLFFPQVASAKSCGAFIANLSSFVLDYVTRLKIGGTHLNQTYMKQLPILPPATYDATCKWLGNPLDKWIISHVLDLTHTAWDTEGFAHDCRYDGPPFRWDEERRFQLRCELDALFFHLYFPCDDAGGWKSARIADGAVRDETDEELATLNSHSPTPRDAVAYIMETFPIVKRKDIARTEQKDADGNITREGTYRTKDRILEIYDQMLQARRNGEPWQSPLDPPPGPPTDADGNFIPMAEWTHHPSHIHPPKGEALPQDALRHFTDLAAGDIPATPFSIALPNEIAEKLGGEAWTIDPLSARDPMPNGDDWVVVAHPDLQRRDEPCGGIAAGKPSLKERTDASTGETYVEFALKGIIPPATLRLTPEEAKTFRPLGIIRTTS